MMSRRGNPSWRGQRGNRRRCRLSLRLNCRAALAMTLFLSGCSDYLDRRDTVSLSTGLAVETNRFIHTADPLHRRSQNTNLTFEARKMNKAIGAYYEGSQTAAQENALTAGGQAGTGGAATGEGGMTR
jgi:hypothetical protein